MIDTVVFVRSLINPRSVWGQIVFADAGTYELFVSLPVSREFLEVLDRPALVRKFRFVDGMGISEVLEILAGAEIVDLASTPSVSRDPKDDKFLATARAAHADYLISEDNDLLVIGEYQGTKIVNAENFLRRQEQNHHGL